VRLALRITTGAVLQNMVLDPLLIFGIGGWDARGVPCAAATVMPQTIASAVRGGLRLGSDSRSLA
jgi:Na+-driven multidrug efflux pump